jgi:hypothetical protein
LQWSRYGDDSIERAERPPLKPLVQSCNTAHPTRSMHCGHDGNAEPARKTGSQNIRPVAVSVHHVGMMPAYQLEHAAAFVEVRARRHVNQIERHTAASEWPYEGMIIRIRGHRRRDAHIVATRVLTRGQTVNDPFQSAGGSRVEYMEYREATTRAVHAALRLTRRSCQRGGRLPASSHG